MSKFDITRFDSQHNYAIEASAGTGKTYNIVEIVNKLVNDFKVSLNEILIVTFTEKAAGELKDRIRGELPNEDVDGAHIGTIHSFCQDVVKELAISASLPFDMGIVDDNAVLDYIEQYIRSNPMANTITDFLGNGIEVKLETLGKQIKAALSKYYLNVDYLEDDTIISLSNEDIKKATFIKDVCESATFVDPFAEMVRRYPDVGYYYNVLATSPTAKLNDLALEIKKNCTEGFCFDGRIYKANKKNAVLENDAINYFKDRKDIYKKFTKIGALAILYLPQIYEGWQKEKEKSKQQSFDDMIRNVREAVLHNNELKEKLKNNFSYAIIDEFQDTNQRQFDIFKSIFMEDELHHIIVVGDPKQSIYAFQGANVNVYYKAVNDIVAKNGLKCELTKNYRSTAKMVRSCNTLFNEYNFDGTVFEGSDHLDVSVEPKDKEPVAYYDNKEPEAFWVATDPSKPDGIDSEEFARIAVEQIVDCCSKDSNGNTKLQLQSNRKDDTTRRNVTFKDFAVLARSRSEMEEIQSQLKKAGIPFVRYKDNSVFSGKECAHWIALLEAINTVDFTGSNRKKFKKTLFTKFFGYSLKEINNDVFESDDTFEMRKIGDWKRLAFDERWEDLIDDILINSNLPVTMNSLKEIQSLAIYKQIGNFCIDYLSIGNSIYDLIRKLKQLADGDEDEDANGIVEKSTDFESVQIMTIHASKGLEFPVVIAVGGFKGLKSSSEVYVHKNPFDPAKQELTFNKPDDASSDSLAELKRLFYVAYTRAKYILILPQYKDVTENFLRESLRKVMENNVSDLKIINCQNWLDDIIKKQVQAILKKSGSTSTGSADNQLDSLKDMIRAGYKKLTLMHSYSSLSHNHSEEKNESEYVTESGAEVETEDVLEGLRKYDQNGKPVACNYDSNKSAVALPDGFPKGAAVGTALHEIFEVIDYTNYSNELEQVIRKCFRNQAITFKDEWMDPLKVMVDNILSADLPIVHGSKELGETLKLNQIPSCDKNAEAEFVFNKEQEHLRNYFNGFIDLMFKKGDYYSVVDWKSDSLNDEFTSYGDQQQLKNHVDSCYSIQRTLYAYCLIKWLKVYMNKSEEEIFEHHFGGVYYVFMRGCVADTSNGIYCHSWNSWDDLEKSFKEILKDKVR